MIDPFQSISILAESDAHDSIIQFGMFIIIAIGSIIGAVVKKNAEKRQQDEARRKAEEAKGILARRAQREQGVSTPMPPKDTTFHGKMQKAASLRDFIRSHADSAPPTPPPISQPRPSMFAAAPKPIPMAREEEHRLVELEPIEHLPSEEELVHTILPSEENHTRSVSVAKFIRRRGTPAPTPVPIMPVTMEDRSAADIVSLPEVIEPTAHTRVNLMDDKTARAAMIFHEIFSPPKALRTQSELWE